MIDGMFPSVPIATPVLVHDIATKLACIPAAETLTTPLGRVRVVRDGTQIHYLPSVTTILSSEEPEGLRKWKQRVGPKEAKRIVDLASKRGDCVHAASEKYYLSGKQSQLPSMPFEWKHLYATLEKCLAQYDSLAVECDVIHLGWQCSGRFDHLVRTPGQNGVELLDIKSKNKIDLSNVLDRYSSYWIQFVIYSEMLDSWGIHVDRVHLLMCSDLSFKHFTLSRKSPWWGHFLGQFHERRARYLDSDKWKRLVDYARAIVASQPVLLSEF